MNLKGSISIMLSGKNQSQRLYTLWFHLHNIPKVSDKIKDGDQISDWPPRVRDYWRANRKGGVVIREWWSDTRDPCRGGTVWCPDHGDESRNTHMIKLQRTTASLPHRFELCESIHTQIFFFSKQILPYYMSCGWLKLQMHNHRYTGLTVKLYTDFQLHKVGGEVSAPKPCIVQGSTIYTNENT